MLTHLFLILSIYGLTSIHSTSKNYTAISEKSPNTQTHQHISYTSKNHKIITNKITSPPIINHQKKDYSKKKLPKKHINKQSTNTFTTKNNKYNKNNINIQKYLHHTIDKKIQKKIKKHIQKILQLTTTEITLLQDLYHQLYILKQKQKQKFNTITIETKQYLKQEQTLRDKLITNLNLPRFSIYYPNDHKYDTIPIHKIDVKSLNLLNKKSQHVPQITKNKTKQMHIDKIQNATTQYPTTQYQHQQKQRKLLSQYEKFVHRTAKNIRQEAQQYRTLEYEIYGEQRKLFLQLPNKLRIFLYQHCNIKKLPIHIKQKIIQSIIKINAKINYYK